ncbi:MAG: hypothetical protein ACRCZE_00475 [Candidatus Altimarinota bacterium]
MTSAKTLKALALNSKKAIATALVTILGTALFGITAVSAQGGFITPTDNPNAVASATGGEGSARALVLTIVNFFLGFLGLVAVLMVIYGGVLVMTAAGDADKASTGKKILLYAVIGIVIILLSFAFVNTILSAGSGTQA